jgi:hypothetical protein
MCFGGGSQPTAPTQLPAASLTDSRPSVNITTDPPAKDPVAASKANLPGSDQSSKGSGINTDLGV